MVISKALIFKREQHGGIGGIHRCLINPQPPAAIGHCIGAQQLPVPIQHLDRGFQRQGRQHRIRDPLITKITRSSA